MPRVEVKLSVIATLTHDVFVTDNGKADEAVIGWITNDIINENAKV